MKDHIIPIIWTGKEKQIYQNITLSEIGENVTLLLFLFGKNQNSVKINVKIVHKQIQAKSKIIVRGVIKDRACVNFNGLIRIERGSKGSSAWLEANLLSLSNQAKGIVVPSLEILESDVRAGHAVTVGKVNDSELFYLMTRGLSRTKAEKLIIKGFLDKLLNDFPEIYKKEQIFKKLKYAI
jgi:Fe-S cluster assembly protein SufD